jgi:hypothetical protein
MEYKGQVSLVPNRLSVPVLSGRVVPKDVAPTALVLGLGGFLLGIDLWSSSLSLLTLKYSGCNFTVK